MKQFAQQKLCGQKHYVHERLCIISDRFILFCVQSELMTYISQVLEDAEQKWNNGEELKKEDGCYVSPVAYDIIQVQ